MWSRKRQKKPPDVEEPELSEIIPFVTLERIVLPKRLTKTPSESAEDAEEKEKLENIAKDYTLNLERAKKQVNDIQNTHK